MILMTVNSGSASIKLAAFEANGAEPPRRIDQEHRHDPDADARKVLGAFLRRADMTQLVAVAHRVVHGGTRLIGPVRIDAAVEAEIDALSPLAPLHNPLALRWVASARALCGSNVAQVAAFDTAFFANLPRVAAEYALPASIGTDHGVRRYGFHGLAHEALWRRWCELRPDLAAAGRLITLQLGGGASVSAIAAGHPIDTSMGFSPLEGLVMATRSGDIDPAVIPYLERRLGCSSERIVERLNRDSGLRGLSGVTSDMSELIGSSTAEARFAVELYCYRARKYVGAYLAALGGCDGIVFGGGVGEHIPGVRERILLGMTWAGIAVDRAANDVAIGREARISSAATPVSVYVIPVDEEQALARAALHCLGDSRAHKSR